MIVVQKIQFTHPIAQIKTNYSSNYYYMIMIFYTIQ